MPDSILENVCCSRTELQLVADAFCCALGSVARCLEHDEGENLVDLTWGHFWSLPPDAPCSATWSDLVVRCGCGLCDKEENLNWQVLQGHVIPFSPKSCIGKSCATFADNPILDSFTAKCNGLQVAVETACLLLDLSFVIEDQN